MALLDKLLGATGVPAEIEKAKRAAIGAWLVIVVLLLYIAWKVR